MLVRWLGLCLLAGVIGGLAVSGPVLGRAARKSGSLGVAAGVRLARVRILGLAAVCAALAGAVGIVRLADAAQRVTTGTSRAPLDALPNLLFAGLAWRRVAGVARARPVRVAAGGLVLGFGVYGLANAASLSQHIKAGLICLN